MSAKESDVGSKEDSKQADTPIDSLSDPDLKIILLGDSAVGKSKLIERYLMNEYNPRQLSTYALTLFRKEIELEGESSKTLIGKSLCCGRMQLFLHIFMASLAYTTIDKIHLQ